MAYTTKEIANTILDVLHKSDPNMRGGVFNLEQIFKDYPEIEPTAIFKVALDLQSRGLLSEVGHGEYVQGSITVDGHKEAEGFENDDDQDQKMSS